METTEGFLHLLNNQLFSVELTEAHVLYTFLVHLVTLVFRRRYTDE